MTKNGLEDKERVSQAGIEPQVIEVEPQTKRKSKSTGPRTIQGKRLSSMNALKRGLFSKIVVLKSESPKEYQALLGGFQEDFRPVGTFESFLVEKLAANAWRQRRLLQQEGSEISSKMLSVETGTMKALEIQRLEYAAPDEKPLSCGFGVETMRELRLIRKAIGCLTKYLACAEADRPGNEEELARIRASLFGAEAGNKDRDTLELLEISRATAEYAAANGCNDPEKLPEYMRQVLKLEINRLERLENAILIVEMGNAMAKSDAVPLLPERTSDQLVRREAHLSREFDRTLTQLERLQRIRKGQPVPPTLRVEVNP